MRVAVVGAGIVGLAAARTVLRAAPDAELVVIDKEPAVGAHQTGHNSGVLHAGLYYVPGSLKARLCRRGVELMSAYCAEQRIALEQCGKVLVATNEVELARAEGILERSRANGVPGVRMVSESELRTLEPQASGIGGLHSPTTAILDFRQVARHFADDVVSLGGRLELGVHVAAVREDASGCEVVLADGGARRADRVLVCAGLHADRLARASGRSPDPRIIPFRGEYYALRPGRESLVRGLIYPVPDPSLPFLGVHLTRMIGGSVLVGPNAVLALAREGYLRRTVRPADVVDIVGWSGMRRLAARHWRAGAAEIARSASRRVFVRAAQAYVPELRSGDLDPAPAGVRAQAVDAAGELLDDFVVDAGRRVVWVRNAPSPAATSSMAIGEELAERLGIS